MTNVALPAQLRQRLRARTAQAHARLDGRLGGGFADRRAYRSYLRGMHAFVASLLPSVRTGSAGANWVLPAWEGALIQDMACLRVRALEREPVSELGWPAVLGALYVVEGAGLGARILVRQARALGHERGTGATFLHMHAEGEGGTRWPRFLALLERAEGDPGEDASCAAALQAFALAERCFHRAQEPA